jgi:hypothetical protein
MWDEKRMASSAATLIFWPIAKFLIWTFRLHNDSPFRHYVIGIKEQVEVES